MVMKEQFSSFSVAQKPAVISACFPFHSAYQVILILEAILFQFRRTFKQVLKSLSKSSA